MKRKLYVSMMCADFSNLIELVRKLDLAKIDGFHMDIMDGVYVNNFALGSEDIKAVRKLTRNIVDAHLMVKSPSKVIDIFLNLGLDIIYIHSEVDEDIMPVLKKISENNIKAGLAINPETEIDEIQHLLPIVDLLLVMTVAPGFAGQSYQESVNPKIEELVKLKEFYNYEIFIDGALSPQRISELSKVGVDGFILGTSSTLFNSDNNYEKVISMLQKI